MRTHFVAMLGLLAVACTGKSQEAPVRSVATPVVAPTPYRASPSGAPSAYAASPSAAPAPRTYPGGAPSYASAPAAEPMAAGSLNWYSRIADAQAAARASGKLILVGSTKPGCSLCEKFAHTTAPQCWARLGQVAVPYMYDITRPEDVRVDRTLRANLTGASLMPLVGFLTPDLQWVSGFSGPRSVAEFMGDIESARRIYPVHAAALPQPGPITGSPTAMLNEFGETEWSAPADWPAAEDALGPVAGVATPAAPTAPAPAVSEPVAGAEPAPRAAPEPVAAPEVRTPAEPVAVAGPAPAPAPVPEALPGSAAAGWSTPDAITSASMTAAIPSAPPSAPPRRGWRPPRRRRPPRPRPRTC